MAAAVAGIAALTTLRGLAAQTSPTEARSKDMDIEIKRNGSRPSTKGPSD
jgi:hypothetical protein